MKAAPDRLFNNILGKLYEESLAYMILSMLHYTWFLNALTLLNSLFFFLPPASSHFGILQKEQRRTNLSLFPADLAFVILIKMNFRWGCLTTHLICLKRKSTNWIWFHEGVPFPCCCCLCLILSAKGLTFSNLIDKIFVMQRENSGKWDETNRTSREKKARLCVLQDSSLRKKKRTRKMRTNAVAALKLAQSL